MGGMAQRDRAMRPRFCAAFLSQPARNSKQTGVELRVIRNIDCILEAPDGALFIYKKVLRQGNESRSHDS